MSDIVVLLTSLASFGVSVACLLVTVAAYRRLDDQTSETFAVIGADEGNHEARLERLETKVGLQVIPSPSALDGSFDVDEDLDGGLFQEEFTNGQEDAALRADESDHAVSAATNEGMAYGD